MTGIGGFACGAGFFFSVRRVLVLRWLRWWCDVRQCGERAEEGACACWGLLVVTFIAFFNLCIPNREWFVEYDDDDETDYLYHS